MPEHPSRHLRTGLAWLQEGPRIGYDVAGNLAAEFVRQAQGSVQDARKQPGILAAYDALIPALERYQRPSPEIVSRLELAVRTLRHHQ